MKLLIEGEEYPISQLQNIFEDYKFYSPTSKGNGRVKFVGYYHSYSIGKQEVILMLPKIFISDKNPEETVLNIENKQISKNELVNIFDNYKKHESSLNWLKLFTIYFYNSLVKFKQRHEESIILEPTQYFELNSNLGNHEYSYLDLLLSFQTLYKKNKDLILFKYQEIISASARKTKWTKTIRKSLPIIIENKPLYTKITNIRKTADNEEDLLIYFFSILNYLNTDNLLGISINKNIPIIKGERFDNLLDGTGLRKIKRIKYKYFSDILKRIYSLCELFFTLNSKSGLRQHKEDFICVYNYNLVFEDMIDFLLSDDIEEIESLKHNADGKIIDHIYSQDSLFDPKDIFYIGDSKYYKHTTGIGFESAYKQFTYAKNIIQVNIDVLNKRRRQIEKINEVVYRDKTTEGYNITPNFLIFGYIPDYTDFSLPKIDLRGEPIKSFHFKDRLFDRDSLFIQQYSINFLYALKAYTSFGKKRRNEIRIVTRKIFRENFINYFNTQEEFNLYKLTIKFENADLLEKLEQFVNSNFKILNGKCYLTSDKEFILALTSDDQNILTTPLISDFLQAINSEIVKKVLY